MKLSGFLQSPDLLESLPRKTREELRGIVLTKGRQWFDSFPEESMAIARNLRGFSISPTRTLVQDIQNNVLLHYYEKLLPLCHSPAEFHRYLTERFVFPPEMEALEKDAREGAGAVVAVCHFGAVECIPPALAARGIPVYGALRFSTPGLAQAARARAADMAASGRFAPVDFIEIGGGGAAALDMAAVLRRGGVLLAVFDEKTPYSVPVTLLRRKVWGGAGLDRIVRLAKPGAKVYTAFAERKDGETYGLRLHRLDADDASLVQSMYDDLEPLVTGLCSQWYFLHEEIPFAD
jgi:lauroyl/myristoyl acyltransferase